MDRLKRLLLVALATSMLAALVGPAGASTDARSQQRRARERRARLAGELDTLRASEAQLVRAERDLDAQVTAQSQRVASARQAVAAAEREAAAAAAAATAAQQRISATRSALVERAIAEFMRGGPAPPEVVDATDAAAAGRRRALLDSVAANEEDLIDELHASREDYELQRAAAEDAAGRARAREREASRRLARLVEDQRAQRRLRAAVATRRREVLGEIDAQARSEAALSRLIAERSRPGASPTRPGPVGRGGCVWPTSGRVTSEYGSRWGRRHQGIDIAAPTGNRIVAAKGGVVIFAGRQSGYGNVVIIDHGGMTTLYAHQSRLAASDGQTVARGQQIGYVGSTGRSTGPHLHFETRYGGAARNPRTCLT